MRRWRVCWDGSRRTVDRHERGGVFRLVLILGRSRGQARAFRGAGNLLDVIEGINGLFRIHKHRSFRVLACPANPRASHAPGILQKKLEKGDSPPLQTFEDVLIYVLFAGH